MQLQGNDIESYEFENEEKRKEIYRPLQPRVVYVHKFFASRYNGEMQVLTEVLEASKADN